MSPLSTVHEHKTNIKPVLKALAVQYCTWLELIDFVEYEPWDCYFDPYIWKS